MPTICLHYQSKAEFFVNSDWFVGLEYMPAEGQTRIDIIGAPGAYKCIETPDQINELAAQASAPAREVALGGQGAVHGDGSPLETREAAVAGYPFFDRESPPPPWDADRPV